MAVCMMMVVTLALVPVASQVLFNLHVMADAMEGCTLARNTPDVNTVNAFLAETSKSECMGGPMRNKKLSVLPRHHVVPSETPVGVKHNILPSLRFTRNYKTSW